MEGREGIKKTGVCSASLHPSIQQKMPASRRTPLWQGLGVNAIFFFLTFTTEELRQTVPVSSEQ